MTMPDDRTPYVSGPENLSTAHTNIWPQPTSYTLPGPSPQPSPPKKKHTARTVALIVAGAVLAVCGLGGIAAIADGGGSTRDKAVTSDTTPDPTPAATTEAAVAAPAAKPKPTTPAVKPLSVEQQNAIQAAKDYLDYTAFSRKGLIQQLHSDAGDGYPLKVATYAVDSLHINYNEQAAKSAKEYLGYSSFSRRGLIEQLESDAGEGFTHAQAVYGVTKAGL